MNLWGIFVTGLLAGGASCAAVQGGLLVASAVQRSGGVAMEQPPQLPRSAIPGKARTAHQRRNAARLRTRQRQALLQIQTAPPRSLSDQIIPLAGFLSGKFTSHVLLGAGLGAFGAAVQPSFQARAVMQLIAGGFLLLLAANLLGAPGLSWLVPAPPARLRRLVRRSARLDAVFAPVLLGLLTVLIPCGVTLSVMFLVIASGSPLWGAAAMAVFVIGTSPLFAAIGFLVRRGAQRLRRLVAIGSGIVVLASGLVAIDTGLVLADAPFTLRAGLQQLFGPGPEALAAPIGGDGIQHLVIKVASGSYTPSRLKAIADVPTDLTFRTNGLSGCTRVTVIPSLGVQRSLPSTGDDTIDLGRPQVGSLRYTCGMGMYSGSIKFTTEQSKGVP